MCAKALVAIDSIRILLVSSHHLRAIRGACSSEFPIVLISSYDPQGDLDFSVVFQIVICSDRSQKLNQFRPVHSASLLAPSNKTMVLFLHETT